MSSGGVTGGSGGVELLSAPVSGLAQASDQAGDGLARATQLGGTALRQSLTSTGLVSSSTSAGDTLLLAAMAGAALALVGTAWESARRQRARVATGRVRGRRALR